MVDACHRRRRTDEERKTWDLGSKKWACRGLWRHVRLEPGAKSHMVREGLISGVGCCIKQETFFSSFVQSI
jgi:hypothetical protein